MCGTPDFYQSDCFFQVYSLFWDFVANGNVGRKNARTKNAFQAMFRGEILSYLLMMGAQKILRICSEHPWPAWDDSKASRNFRKKFLSAQMSESSLLGVLGAGTVLPAFERGARSMVQCLRQAKNEYAFPPPYRKTVNRMCSCNY